MSTLEKMVQWGIISRAHLKAQPPIDLPLSRKGLAKLFGQLGFKLGAEIGVRRGIYSRVLWERTRGTIYSIDPWMVYDEYDEAYTQAVMEKHFRQSQRRFEGSGCVIMRMRSEEAAELIEDDSLDFVYIDGNHKFEYVTQDIAMWSKKVRVDGIISGHDFIRYPSSRPSGHVLDVVTGWAYSHHIRPWFVCRGRGGSSWFWVKS